jgi:hypothetical protein
MRVGDTLQWIAPANGHFEFSEHSEIEELC